MSFAIVRLPAWTWVAGIPKPAALLLREGTTSGRRPQKSMALHAAQPGDWAIPVILAAADSTKPMEGQRI
jgi:hypothetical protein